MFFSRKLAILSFAWLLLLFALTAPSYAALKIGDNAPDFTTYATKGGKNFTYHLQEALKHGPVVLYFFPAAFTTNCTLEAHDFAEAVQNYKKLGATVMGISMDPLKTLQKFSVSECRSAFPVAADPTGHITQLYDSQMPQNASQRPMAQRTSYVILPNGKILFSYTNNDPDEHVSRTLKALATLQK